jgi:2-amino-4-hydroxy-6-hydroxymethyldihydropteridine diphosphokinase
MSLCLIGLGSNLGDRQAMLAAAVARLGRRPQIEIVRQSDWLETRPAGGPPGQAAFLNGAVVVQTSLSPDELLAALQQIEAELGRQRGERWGPRAIDLDLLLYDDVTLATPRLVLPHPQMAWRRFVLEPACQVVPDMPHPGTGWTIARLLENLNASPRYVAIAGPVGDDKTLLAQRVAERSGGVRKKGTGTSLRSEPVPIFRPVSIVTGPRANSPSHDLAWELKLLQERSQLLAAEGPHWRQPEGTTVSDFWFDEGPAFVELGLPPDQGEQYRAAWRQVQAGAVRPRLIVLLEAPDDELSAAILRRALAPDQGPLLRHASSDLRGAEEELIGAIEAMQ